MVSSHVGGSLVLTLLDLESSTNSEGSHEPSRRPIAYYAAVAARRLPLLLNALIAAPERGGIIKYLNSVHQT